MSAPVPLHESQEQARNGVLSIHDSIKTHFWLKPGIAPGTYPTNIQEQNSDQEQVIYQPELSGTDHSEQDRTNRRTNPKQPTRGHSYQ